jgi:hypothetical protein
MEIVEIIHEDDTHNANGLAYHSQYCEAWKAGEHFTPASNQTERPFKVLFDPVSQASQYINQAGKERPLYILMDREFTIIDTWGV